MTFVLLVADLYFNSWFWTVIFCGWESPQVGVKLMYIIKTTLLLPETCNGSMYETVNKKAVERLCGKKMGSVVLVLN